MDAPATTDIVNIGVGKGISILELAEVIRDAVGYKGRIVLDPSKPDGAPFKTVDGARGARLLGWSPTRGLRQGIQDTVAWYVEQGAAQ